LRATAQQAASPNHDRLKLILRGPGDAGPLDGAAERSVQSVANVFEKLGVVR